MARHPEGRLIPAVVLLLGLVAMGLLLSSPRHRQFYFRLLPRSPATTTATSPAPAPAPTPAVTPSREAPGPAPVGIPGPVGPTPPASPRRPAEGPKPERAAGTAVPQSGLGERVVVKVVDAPPRNLPSSELPSGWNLKEFAGRAQVEVVRENSRLAFRLVSQGTSFALHRDVVLDPKQFPILTWRWKVIKLPAAGDVRELARDDQAAQVYLVFPRWPSPRINSDVVGYVWDSGAPVGVTLTSHQSANVKLMVLQSGRERLGQWVQEERNVYQDYVALFQREPPRIGKVAVMVDSNNTRSQAEAFIEDLTFLRPTPGPSTGHQAGSK